jgi:hypothetical protein
MEGSDDQILPAISNDFSSIKAFNHLLKSIAALLSILQHNSAVSFPCSNKGAENVLLCFSLIYV